MVLKIWALIICSLIMIQPSMNANNNPNYTIPLTLSALCAAGVAYGSWKVCDYCLNKMEDRNLSVTQSIFYHALLLASATTTAISGSLSPLFLIDAVNSTDLDLSEITSMRIADYFYIRPSAYLKDY